MKHMSGKKILFISGSLGLGHVLRDLAIAHELRRRDPEVEISWLAVPPASMVLGEAGERLVPEADKYANENVPAEEAAGQYQLSLLKYLTRASKEWAHNVEVFNQLTNSTSYDLVIGDETYEIATALIDRPDLLEAPFVMVYDFFGSDAVSASPLEQFGTYLWCRVWARIGRLFTHRRTLGLFVGEAEDIPDTKLGFLLPNRRDLARNYLNFTGYVLPFDPSEYMAKGAIRAKLGYGENPLVVCTIGGTAVGRALLELCGQAFPHITARLPDLRMVIVCGPRVDPQSLPVPEGIEVRGYVPALYEHLAACDLAITQGGGTTTLELTALRRPFLYFPLGGHFEQQVHVAYRLARHGAGIRMSFRETCPVTLAAAVLENLGKQVEYGEIRVNGAEIAAGLIHDML